GPAAVAARPRRLQGLGGRLDHAAHRAGLHEVAHGGHLPLAGELADQLGHHHARLRLGGGEVEPDQLLTGGAVQQTAVRLGDLGELLAGEGVDGEDQAGDLLGEPAEVDGDHLVVPGALAGEIVAGVLDRAVQDLQLAEVAAVDVVALRTVGDDRGVQVDVLAARRRLPPGAHRDWGERRRAAFHRGAGLVFLEAARAFVRLDLARAGGRGGGGGGRGGGGGGLRADTGGAGGAGGGWTAAG